MALKSTSTGTSADLPLIVYLCEHWHFCESHCVFLCWCRSSHSDHCCLLRRERGGWIEQGGRIPQERGGKTESDIDGYRKTVRIKVLLDAKRERWEVQEGRREQGSWGQWGEIDRVLTGVKGWERKRQWQSKWEPLRHSEEDMFSVWPFQTNSHPSTFSVLDLTQDLKSFHQLLPQAFISCFLALFLKE